MPTREKRGDKSTCRGVFSKQVLGMVGSVKDLFLCRHGACTTKENLPDRSDGAPAIDVQRKIHVQMRRELTESFSAVLYLFTLLGVSLFSIWEPHCGAVICCVECDRNYSFEVAIRTSFFDDDAESLGKKRLVVDDETESDLRLSGRSVTLWVTQNKSFLADPFRNTHDLRLSCRSNVLAHCMRPQKSLLWVWRLGERWTFRIDHGQSHVDVGHVVFIMICVHIQRHDSECQTFRSEVCRPPFEYGIGTISCHTDSWCADETARTLQKMKIRY